MARAYYDCPQCGTTITVYERNRREADRYAGRLKEQGACCESCRKAELLKEGLAAAERNADAGLPQLTGSPNQVAWAEKIRETALADLDVFLALLEANARSLSYDSPEVEAIFARARTDSYTCLYTAKQLALEVRTPQRCAVFIGLVRAQTRASWWIDHRYPNYDRIAATFANQINEAMLQAAAPDTAELAEEATREAYIRPVGEPISACVAELTLQETCITTVLPEYNASFGSILRALGFAWKDGRWQKLLSAFTGDPLDRMAEAAHRLVAGGYIVAVHDNEARRRAVEGDYRPEQRRWIIRRRGGVYDGWFRIIWPKGDDFYAVARSLPGSRYNGGCTLVPPGAIEALVEFAEKYEFALSQEVAAELAAHREALAAGAVVTDIKDAPVAVVVPYSSVPAPLDAPTEVSIPANLLDDAEEPKRVS